MTKLDQFLIESECEININGARQLQDGTWSISNRTLMRHQYKWSEAAPGRNFINF